MINYAIVKKSSGPWWKFLVLVNNSGTYLPGLCCIIAVDEEVVLGQGLSVVISMSGE
jgi:hypothetical protein